MRMFINAITSMAAMAAMEKDVYEAMNVRDMVVDNVADFSKPRRRRTGKKYPFSNTRQNERFARQLAAGQIKFA
jgi:hypothetical protein